MGTEKTLCAKCQGDLSPAERDPARDTKTFAASNVEIKTEIVRAEEENWDLLIKRYQQESRKNGKVCSYSDAYRVIAKQKLGGKV